jgi:hypothetical protein
VVQTWHAAYLLKVDVWAVVGVLMQEEGQMLHASIWVLAINAAGELCGSRQQGSITALSTTGVSKPWWPLCTQAWLLQMHLVKLLA